LSGNAESILEHGCGRKGIAWTTELLVAHISNTGWPLKSGIESLRESEKSVLLFVFINRVV
jgi:hypothetical protein